MNDSNLHVLSNIIAAVESGGQVYSENRDWTAYAGAYANTENEHTCTLGPYQAYGDEAQELIQHIHDNAPDVFAACDPEEIIAEKLGVSWVGTKWDPNEKEKSILIVMLATQAGHAASEAVFQERLSKYITRAESNGVTGIDGQMMWAEVQHLGGLSAVQRIAKRLTGFTCADWLAALKQDQSSSRYKSNGVGAQKYWSRHVKCVEFIEEYADLTDGQEKEEPKKVGVTAQDIIAKAAYYIGYREKDHASADLEDFKADAGSNNYTKFSVLCGYGIQPWQWCQLFVCGVAVEVCGSISAAEQLLCDQDLNDGVLTSYTPTGSSYFKKARRWYTEPQVGDVVYFYSTSMGRICHVGYVETVDTDSRTFGTIEGNTNSDGFTTNGGCVARHSYSYANVGGTNRVAGFGRPRYGTVEAVNEADQYTGTRHVIAMGQLHLNNYLPATSPCRPIKVDGVFGPKTQKAGYAALQHSMNLDYNIDLETDGIPGTLTRGALKGHYIKKGETQYLVTYAEIACLLKGRETAVETPPGTYGDGLTAALGNVAYLDADALIKLLE